MLHETVLLYVLLENTYRFKIRKYVIRIKFMGIVPKWLLFNVKRYYPIRSNDQIQQGQTCSKSLIKAAEQVHELD